ncbi:hypothetical protein DL89DRAFT_27129 [Linderina pennispora]|uniref:Uncharacterized protein n=1 Tax=Linderina pennispora TaxID=61395 RepID=A0A1Y1W3V0_9FUNG|nr:uncharacterized protein DL89DRAFT_27129 [Linderina pennispora]ORX68127.1 hypothetical protein DL89DRAFT_27129 [Linderina pennispora]
MALYGQRWTYFFFCLLYAGGAWQRQASFCKGKKSGLTGIEYSSQELWTILRTDEGQRLLATNWSAHASACEYGKDEEIKMRKCLLPSPTLAKAGMPAFPF